MKSQRTELTVIEKMRDLIKWYVPIIERFPRSYRYNLGARIENLLYQILEELVIAKFEKTKTERLFAVNTKLELLRQQSRLLIEFNVIDGKRLNHLSGLINSVGVEVGGWLKYRKEAK